MRDLRTWLDEVNKIGQLMTVEDVHWDLQLSTLTEIINERSKTRPAIIFDRIKDYPPGYRVRQSGIVGRPPGDDAWHEARVGRCQPGAERQSRQRLAQFS